MIYTSPQQLKGRHATVSRSHGGDGGISTFSPFLGGTRDESDFAIDVTGAAPDSFISISVTAPGAREPFLLTVPVGPIQAATTPALKAAAITCKFTENPRVMGYGRVAFNPTSNLITFVANQPGFPVDFDMILPAGATGSITNRAALPIGGQNVPPGYVAVLDPANGVSRSVLGGQSVRLPSQNLALSGSTQRWVGIALDCDSAEEQAPVTQGFPGFSNIDSPCQRPKSCYRVLSRGSIWLVVEQVPAANGKLYYAWSGPDAGRIFASPGVGAVAATRAELPVQYLIEQVHGTLIEVTLS